MAPLDSAPGREGQLLSFARGFPPEWRDHLQPIEK
jgi:hypothetical protein